MTVTKPPKFNPVPYMVLSIEEMNKSHNEPRSDGKVPPKVGAVLVFPDGRVVRAHRGELREGDHAEFTLLERKLAHEKLDDCVLFTTLEPCVKRNIPKIGCSKRTVNARIRKVYVGIQDPDPTVAGKGTKYLEEHGVAVVMFDRNFQKIIEKENQHFLDQAKTRSIQVSKEESKPSFEQPNLNAELSDLSNLALEYFIKEAKIGLKKDSHDFLTYLTELGILGFDPIASLMRPTGYGLILFGEKPNEFYKQSSLIGIVHPVEKPVQLTVFNQPIILIPKDFEKWVMGALNILQNPKAFSINDFPKSLVKEAVINALVHRDYSLSELNSMVEIYQNKIIVRSPGAPLASILHDNHSFNLWSAPTVRRNPMIAYIFNLIGLGNGKELNIESFSKKSEDLPMQLPKYTMENEFLKLTFDLDH